MKKLKLQKNLTNKQKLIAMGLPAAFVASLIGGNATATKVYAEDLPADSSIEQTADNNEVNTSETVSDEQTYVEPVQTEQVVEPVQTPEPVQTTETDTYSNDVIAADTTIGTEDNTPVEANVETNNLVETQADTTIPEKTEDTIEENISDEQAQENVIDSIQENNDGTATVAGNVIEADTVTVDDNTNANAISEENNEEKVEESNENSKEENNEEKVEESNNESVTNTEDQNEEFDIKSIEKVKVNEDGSFSGVATPTQGNTENYKFFVTKEGQVLISEGRNGDVLSTDEISKIKDKVKKYIDDNNLGIDSDKISVVLSDTDENGNEVFDLPNGSKVTVKEAEDGSLSYTLDSKDGVTVYDIKAEKSDIRKLTPEQVAKMDVKKAVEPETPKTPDVPEQPKTPETPEQPTTPETPDVPEQPKTPETPEEKGGSETPEVTPTPEQPTKTYSLQKTPVTGVGIFDIKKLLLAGAALIGGITLLKKAKLLQLKSLRDSLAMLKTKADVMINGVNAKSLQKVLR